MITTYFKNLLANYTLGGRRAVNLPEKLYLGLSTGDPGLNGTGAREPAIGSATGYSRVELPQLSEADDGLVTNEGMISMSESRTAWGTMPYWIICDQPSGGNVLLYGSFAEPKAVNAQASFSIRPGELKLSVGQIQ